ncbi:MAG: isoprenoid biosynthesis glyoxalase ElbB [Planctomycetota bacterium]|nr:isoprenoid biosynthesis glyoxalase ElbB [Planctomycetota bacterium]
MPKTCAVVLSGCGRADGSEIHESVSILVHLSRLGVAYKCFAPDAPQAQVINHATGAPAPGGQTRNMMVEAARIARGDIAPLHRLEPGEWSAVVFAGGFGAAKNLCTYGEAGDRGGANCEVLPDVQRVIQGFHRAGKPIGLCCIAPVLAARVLGTRKGGPGVKVTIGTDAATAEAIAMMGSTNVPKSVMEAYVDEQNLVVTTPAYMCDAAPHEVFAGIGRMCEKVAELAR